MAPNRTNELGSPGHRVVAVRGVGGDLDPMIADPAAEHVEHLARQLGLLAVGVALARALLLVAVEPEQDRQRPRPP
jgi:hypothetical protein